MIFSSSLTLPGKLCSMRISHHAIGNTRNVACHETVEFVDAMIHKQWYVVAPLRQGRKFKGHDIQPEEEIVTK